MNRQTIIRAMAAIALLLAVNISADAQLGGALNRARNAVQGATGNNAGTNNAVKQAAEAAGVPAGEVEVTPANAWMLFTPDERAAFEKIMDESKRTAPKVSELCDYQRDHKIIRDWFGRSASKPLGSHQTVENAKTFKAAIETRNNENVAIYDVLWETDPDDAKAKKLKQHVRQEFSNRSSMADDRFLEEMANYRVIMSMAADLVPRGKVGPGQYGLEINVDWSRAGVLSGMVQERDGKTVFVSSGRITPLDNETYESECNKLDIIQTLLQNEDSETQRDEYWLAMAAKGNIVQAQRNSK